MLRIGWFSTGRDEAARELLTVVHDAIEDGSLRATIAFVFCNRERGEGVESDAFIRLVEELKIPLVAFSSAGLEPGLRRRGLLQEHNGEPETIAGWRELYDRAVIELLRPYPIDLGVLAGYMLIVSPLLCKSCDLINLHPAAPGGPKGTWQEVIWQLIDERAQRTGAMMHLVTPELDEGPPITYCSFSLKNASMEPLWSAISGRSAAEVRKMDGETNSLFGEIRRRGVIRELPLILHTLRAFADGNIRIENGQVVARDGRVLDGGYSLTERIDEEISTSKDGEECK